MSDQAHQPTLSQVRAFVAVAEYRHFGTAATRLNVSQPTLSQALASLEHALGVQLIERSTRKVLVTTAGKHLLPDALATVEAADRFFSAAAGVGNSLTGRIRIGFIPTIGPYVLPELLPALRENVPGLALQVVEDQTARLLDDLRAGALDLATVVVPADSHGLIEIPLYRENFVLVVPQAHVLSGKTELPIDVLGEFGLLLLEEGHCLRDQTLELCRSVEAHPDTVGSSRVNSLTTLLQCVAGGLGVALVPEMSVGAIAGAGLAIGRFAEPVPGRTIGLAFRGSSARRQDYELVAELLRATAPATAIFGSSRISADTPSVGRPLPQ
ncbi:LysR substrate-binding domain-containing protein [Antrihabitans stalactiti]|uniref:Probable hydrogen peroxide-inducible genes activator n=1 Tax=Antrihabitans stalactiti TaxID=2584121 RepID=A0A848K9H7_9NOCA|nr:LysR substrate-binding domain-containing protein [Antrihabitans stalactiti]NMN94098.1 LysR family transcriptional regulator [Antrihabitans stalactiti]